MSATTMSWSPTVAKEARALALPWLACLSIMVLERVMGDGFFMVGVPAYVLGAAILAAMAIGHEFSHGTLGLLLSQPASRQRILVVKTGVLVVALLSIYVIGQTTLFSGDSRRSAALLRQLGTGIPLFPLIWALCVAPWFTMLTRSVLAGAVFTVGLAGSLIFAGALVGRLVGTNANDAHVIQTGFFWIAAGLCATAGLVLGPRTFMRLESIDGGGAPPLPRWLEWSYDIARPRRGDPLANLVKKELWLHQVSFVAAACYVVASAALLAASSLPGYRLNDVRTGIAILFGWTTALLIGAVASAEERQLQMIEWQHTQPIGQGTQWTIKAVTALALTIVLSIGLPVVFVMVSSVWVPMSGVPDLVVLAPLLGLVTIAGLYVSSLCANGVQALITSLVVVVAAGVFQQAALVRVYTWAFETTARMASIAVPHGYTPPVTVAMPAFILVSAALWWFGARNHASTATTWIEVAMQAAVIALTAIVSVMLSAAIVALSF